MRRAVRIVILSLGLVLAVVVFVGITVTTRGPQLTQVPPPAILLSPKRTLINAAGIS